MIWGYDDKINFFQRLIEEKKLKQAYLFYGEPEIGKFTFAKHLASFIETGKWEDKKLLIDSLFLNLNDQDDLAGGKETLGIEKILEAENFLYQRPLTSERKILIINDAHKLTREAQAALLKIVEEPPQKALIIFIAKEKRELFPALLSRLEKIYFPTLPTKKIEEFLKSTYELDEKKAQKIAGLSFGRVGRAITLTLQKNTKNKETDIEEKIKNIILQLYEDNLQKNCFTLKFLLEKEVEIKRYKRYNLNIKLQEKVINSFLKKQGIWI